MKTYYYRGFEMRLGEHTLLHAWERVVVVELVQCIAVSSNGDVDVTCRRWSKAQRVVEVLWRCRLCRCPTRSSTPWICCCSCLRVVLLLFHLRYTTGRHSRVGMIRVFTGRLCVDIVHPMLTLAVPLTAPGVAVVAG